MMPSVLVPKGVQRVCTLMAILAALALVLAPVAAQAQKSATERLLEIKQDREAKQGGAAGDTGGSATAGATNGEAVEITATGVASWRPDDAARSRSEAIEAAQQEAVEQASGLLLTSESVVRNFDLVQDEVMTRSKGFIRDYEVVKEGTDGPFYNVTIKAVVVKSAFINEVNQSLENLYKRVGKPRVMLVVEEFDLTKPPVLDENGQPVMQNQASLSVVEKEIRKQLLKQGFTFIDARALTAGSQVEQAEKGRAMGRASLLDQARTTKAELVMIGKAGINDGGRLNKFHVVEASVGLDVIRTTTGQVMASEVKLAKGLNVNPETAAVTALQKAADEIAPAVMEQVTFQWIRERSEGARIEMVVQNITYGELLHLRRVLSNEVRGIKRVQQRSFSDGTALLELQSRDSTDRLAESLFQTDFQQFKLDILDVTANSLVVSIKRG